MKKKESRALQLGLYELVERQKRMAKRNREH